MTPIQVERAKVLLDARTALKRANEKIGEFKTEEIRLMLGLADDDSSIDGGIKIEPVVWAMMAEKINRIINQELAALGVSE